MIASTKNFYRIFYEKSVSHFRFINIESSTNEDIEEDEYIRDGTDYGNITRVHDDNEESTPQVTETAFYVDNKPDEMNEEETDLNQTIVAGEDVEPSSSIWEGIMSLVEDIDRDSKSVDVSLILVFNCPYEVL